MKDVIAPQAVNGGSGGTGGNVQGGAPLVQSFASDKTTGDNGGALVVTFTGTIFSPNGERHLSSLQISGSGPSTLTSAHAITLAETKLTSEPASFGSDGYKIWDAGSARDGILTFKYQQAFSVWTTAGVYNFVANVTDDQPASASSSAIAITITKFSLITVGGAPVNAAGAAQTGQNWGQWSAIPGAQNVNSTNFLKLTNDGDKPGVSVVISFSSPTFTGVTDANYTIPINNNIQFSWAEGTSGATPSSLNMTYGATSTGGTVTVTFTAKSNVVYVGYRLVSLPAVLDKESYSAAFTVTEL